MSWQTFFKRRAIRMFFFYKKKPQNNASFLISGEKKLATPSPHRLSKILVNPLVPFQII